MEWTSEIAVGAERESEATRKVFDWGEGRDRIHSRHWKNGLKFGC